VGSFSVLNNISSTNGQQKLNINNLNLNRTLQRLASGRRINSGSDDAAGLQIADSLRGNVHALNQAMRNANDGIGFCQIADGALSIITDILHRMVTLSEEAVSEIISAEGRKALDGEFQALQAEIARIVYYTNYNGMNILDCNLKEYGETLDVFVGDLSAVSYIPVRIGCISPFPESGKATSALQSKVHFDDETITPQGYFNFYTTNAGEDIEANDPLQYPGTYGQWSQPAIRIYNPNGDGTYVDYAVWQCVKGPNTPARPALTLSSSNYDDIAQVHTTTFTTAGTSVPWGVNLTVVQKVTQVKNENDDGESYRIEYEVINAGANVTVDFMYHIETNFHFGAFLVNGNPVTTGTYSGGDIPGGVVGIYTSDPNNNPIISFNSQSGFTFGTAGDPDKVHLGTGSGTSIFDTANTASDGYKGYSLIWEGKTISASSSQSFVTYYGVSTDSAQGEGEVPTKVGGFNMNLDAGLVTSDLLTPENALRALGTVRTALNEVSIMRGGIGAGVNRLRSAINVLAVTSMNTLAAESSIRDANMAEEITNLTKFQILAQTGMAALSQANANARSVLSLLT